MERKTIPYSAKSLRLAFLVLILIALALSLNSSKLEIVSDVKGLMMASLFISAGVLSFLGLFYGLKAFSSEKNVKLMMSICIHGAMSVYFLIFLFQNLFLL